MGKEFPFKAISQCEWVCEYVKKSLFIADIKRNINDKIVASRRKQKIIDN